MLEKQKGVVVAMPFTDAGRVEVWASQAGALTEKVAKEIVELDKDFKVLGFAKKAAKPAGGKTRRKKKTI